MPNTRLLTGLFLTASVVVDLVLLASSMANQDSSLHYALLEGIVLGQVGALAIWTVTGRVHRLARGACLVLATGVLAFITVHQRTWYFKGWLTLLAVYAVLVMAAAGLIALARRAVQRKVERHETLQAPLIELFGWTIVVAIASFGTRFMDARVLEHGLSKLLTTTAIVAIPVVAELLYRPKFHPLHLLRWLLIVGGAYALGLYLADRRRLEIVLATQAAYLAAWMIVRSVESDYQDAETAEPDSAEDTAESETE